MTFGHSFIGVFLLTQIPRNTVWNKIVWTENSKYYNWSLSFFPPSITALNSLYLLELISHCFSLYIFLIREILCQGNFVFRHTSSLLLYTLSVFWFAGRKQAKLTGQRLQELGLPYTKLVRSTMRRANETAQIILTSLPNIPVSDCCLLEEGAPIPPEPPVGSWKPEPYVRLTFCFMLSDLFTI
jgi:hypothetical protein